MKRYIENDKKYIEGILEYIAELKLQYKKSPNKSKEMATEALIRTGVMEKDGKLKKEIVID